MNTLTLNLERNRDAKNPAAKEIDDNTYFRYFYLPHIIMDVFYDYVDTVIQQSVQMRIEPMKKVTRSIRELKKEYDYLRNRYFSFNNREQAAKHMEFFIDVYSREFENEYKLIKWRVSNLNKKMLPDWQVFIASVYMGICVYKALKNFVIEADQGIEKIWGKANHSIMPDMVRQTYPLLEQYLGDCKILSEEDLISSSNRILAMIRRIQFISQKSKGEDTKKTIYQRYLELKGENKKAPSGTTKKLMEEFNISSQNEYYKILKKAALAG